MNDTRGVAAGQSFEFTRDASSRWALPDEVVAGLAEEKLTRWPLPQVAASILGFLLAWPTLWLVGGFIKALGGVPPEMRELFLSNADTSALFGFILYGLGGAISATAVLEFFEHEISKRMNQELVLGVEYAEHVSPNLLWDEDAWTAEIDRANGMLLRMRRSVGGKVLLEFQTSKGVVAKWMSSRPILWVTSAIAAVLMFPFLGGRAVAAFLFW